MPIKRYFCDFCGRCSSEQSVDSNFWPMYMSYDPYLIMCSSCKKAHPDDFKLYFSEKEEKPMDYNKKKDTSINVKRKVTREEDVTVNGILDLDMGDKIKIIIGGEVYEATVARRPASVYSDGSHLDLTVDVYKPLSKSWKELGYDSFEDMINDVAKRHTPLETSCKDCGCLDAADSYGESYVQIEHNGAKTIVHSDSVTVYPVRKEDD